MPAQATRLETLLRRDRLVVVTGLVAITVLSWIYLFVAATGMSSADEAGALSAAAALMPQTQSWGPVELLLIFVMWAIMMVAMMVPSAAPLVLVFAGARRRKVSGQAVGSAGILLCGYLLAWIMFSVPATLAQWGLHAAALLSPMMVSASSTLGGLLLVSAGVFQLTPLKRACLVHCRSPLSFLMAEWRPGRLGTFVMGLKHGLYCVGCCWMLMALLFVAGVMNLLWVAVIALFVCVERVAPAGDFIGRVAGIALICAGIGLVAG